MAGNTARPRRLPLVLIKSSPSLALSQTVPIPSETNSAYSHFLV